MRVAILLSLFVIILCPLLPPCPSNDVSRASAMSDAPVAAPPDDPFDCVLSMAAPASGSMLCELAEIHALAGHKEHALRLLAQADAAVEREKNHPSGLIPGLVYRQQLSRLIVAHSAFNDFDKAIALANSSSEPGLKADHLRRIADDLIVAGQKTRAAELLAQALAAIHSPGEEAKTLSDIAVAYAKLGECDRAIEMAKRIANKWDFLKATALTAVGMECGAVGQSAKALAVFSQAERIARAINDPLIADELKAQALAAIALAYTNAGQKDKGEALLAEALDAARKVEGNAVALEWIAKVHVKAGRYEQAKRIADSANFRETHFDVAMQIAKAYLDAGQRQKAIEVLEPEWQFYKTRKYNLPESWPGELAALAVTFARAAQPDKAAEALLYALRQVRTQHEDSQAESLLTVAKAYATAKLEPDESARDLLRKICNREPIPVTPEEQAMRRRVEEAADHFIRRWHETLDLNVLFDELYVTDAERRWINVAWFAGVYQHLTATAEGPAVDKDVDEATLRAGFMAYWNARYLDREYALAYGKEGAASPTPPGYEALMKAVHGVKLDPKRMSRATVLQFAAKANAVAAAYRPALSPAAFQSPLYQLNRKLVEEEEDEDSRVVRVKHGFKEYRVPETVEVYALRRGIFDFYFVEENGKLKVLTLGFEL